MAYNFFVVFSQQEDNQKMKACAKKHRVYGCTKHESVSKKVLKNQQPYFRCYYQKVFQFVRSFAIK